MSDAKGQRVSKERGSAQQRAHSLLEIMLVATLMLVLLTLIVQVLVPMSKGSVRASEQVGLQQLAAVALDRLVSELQSAPREAIAVLPPAAPTDPPVRLAIHPLGGVGPTGQQSYPNQFVLYWFDPAARRLWRAPWQADFGFEGATLVPSSAQFNAAIAAPPAGTRVAAAHVNEFEVTLEPLRVQIRLALEHPAPDGRPPETFELRRDVLLPNSLY